MAILRVQGNARGVSITNSIAVALASTPTNGNVLVATIGLVFPTTLRTVSSITQTNVVWTQQVTKSYSATPYCSSDVWFGVVSASADVNITIALSGTPSKGGIANVCEYSGLLTVGFLDKTATAGATSATPSTGTTANTTQNDELCVGCHTIHTGAGTITTPTGSFTLLDGAYYATSASAYLERIVSATGAYVCTSTDTGGIDNWAGCIATFKAAAAGAAVVKRRLLMGVGLSANIWNLNKHRLKFPSLNPKRF